MVQHRCYVGSEHTRCRILPGGRESGSSRLPTTVQDGCFRGAGVRPAYRSRQPHVWRLHWQGMGAAGRRPGTLVLAIPALPRWVRRGWNSLSGPLRGPPSSSTHPPRPLEGLCALQPAGCWILRGLPEDNGKLPLSSPGSSYKWKALRRFGVLRSRGPSTGNIFINGNLTSARSKKLTFRKMRTFDSAGPRGQP